MIGVYLIDIDNDVVIDLVILWIGLDILMCGFGNCEFGVFDDFEFDSGDYWIIVFFVIWE